METSLIPVDIDTLDHDNRKRKLHLVKCDRCRHDKQKCLPITRVWPAKCDRCVKKGFACSTGRKIERPTKYEPSFDSESSQQPPTNQEHDSKIDEIAHDWILLKDYRDLIILHLDNLGTLEEELMQPFMSFISRREVASYPELLQTRALLREIIADLWKRESSLRNKIFIENNLSLKSRKYLADILELPSSRTSLSGRACPFCTLDLQELSEYSAERAFVCRDFSLTQSYLLAYLRSHHFPNRHMKEADSMVASLYSKSTLVDKEITSLLKPEGNMVLEPSDDVIISDEIYSATFFYGLRHPEWKIDYLDRLPAHRFLDGMRTDLFRRQEAHLLSTYLLKTGLGSSIIDHKDCLGRTLLHIACQKGWTEGVNVLLDIGADVGQRTCFGSLPIHFAAASGHHAILTLLMAHKAKFDIDHKDVHGHTAAHYARCRGDSVMVSVLSSHASQLLNEEVPSGLTHGEHQVHTDFFPKEISAQHQVAANVADQIEEAGGDSSQTHLLSSVRALPIPQAVQFPHIHAILNATTFPSPADKEESGSWLAPTTVLGALISLSWYYMVFGNPPLTGSAGYWEMQDALSEMLDMLRQKLGATKELPVKELPLMTMVEALLVCYELEQGVQAQRQTPGALDFTKLGVIDVVKFSMRYVEPLTLNSVFESYYEKVEDIINSMFGLDPRAFEERLEEVRARLEIRST